MTVRFRTLVSACAALSLLVGGLYAGAPRVPGSPGVSVAVEASPGGATAGATEAPGRQHAIEKVAGTPLHFARNDGQAPANVRFLAQGVGYTVALRDEDAVIALAGPGGGTSDEGRTVRVGLHRGATPRAATGLEQLPGRLNIIKGSDPARWQQDIPTFARVKYDEVYPGVDLVYYGNQRQLQYDFHVAAGADPSQIGLSVAGADRVDLDEAGNLQLHVGDRVLQQRKPFSYQVVDGEPREVPSRFSLDGDTVRFQLGEYDRSRELVIDPVIAYASWFGAGGEEGVLDLAVDTDGGIVVYGYSHDAEGLLKFPTTNGAAKATRGDDMDAFVTKFNASGSAIVFSTLLGGTGNENFSPYYTGGLALDAAGNVYVTGTTRSADFPATNGTIRHNPTQTTSDDGFYAKLSPTGGPLFGTYIGGNGIDIPWGLDVDAAGNVYIVGRTSSDTSSDASSGDFTVTGNAYDTTFNGTYDLFLMRFNAAGTLTYSSYIGSNGPEGTTAADVKASRTTAGVVYVGSDSGNAAFPTTGSRYQAYVGGGSDAVVLKLDLGRTGTQQLLYSTFFGGNGNDVIVALALDAADVVHVAGSTNSSGATFPGVPTWSGSIAPSGTDVFAARFNTAGTGASSLLSGIRLNGYYTDEADDIALDGLDQPWVTVSSGSLAPTPDPTRDFPLKNTLSTGRSGNGGHPVVVQLNAAGNDVLMSSLIGGDSAGAPHVAVAVTPSGEVWVGSSSGGDIYNSYDYLGVVSPYDATYNGGDTDVTLERIGKRADLGITKSVDKPYPQFTVLPGEQMVYTITVTNTTGDTASNMVVTDNLPPQVVFVSCSATNGGVCGGSGANRTITFPSLAAGQSATATLVCRVADNVGPNTIWTNTATVTSGGTVDPNPGNNTGGGSTTDPGNNGGGGVPSVDNPAADGDKDGLPNGWEQDFGLNPLASNPAGNTTTDPNGAKGDPDGDGRTNLQEYQDGTHPRGFVITYLAEGATGNFFSTKILIANPTTTEALTLTRFQKSDGTTVEWYEIVPGLSRTTIDVGSIPGLEQAEFSTLVEADVQVVVDRTMSWPATGPAVGYGAHSERGILTRTATTWYLAEGATAGAFDLFYLIQNPNTTTANVEVTFLLTSGAPVVKTYPVGPQSRFNIWVDDIPELANAELSAVVRSTNGVPIVVERAMYLSTPQQGFAAGHESAGVTAPSANWFLAEGATGPFFDLFILVANPNNQAASVRARYLLESGEVVTKTYTVNPNSRFNIWVDYEDAKLANAAVSTTITSTNGVPIIVERAMWWGAEWFEAHNSPGSTETGVKWAMAEGQLGGPSNAQTYILIANTSASAGTGQVTLLFEDGTAPVSKSFPLNPNSRRNVDVYDQFPEARGKTFGAIVQSTGGSPVQIVVERAVYYDSGAQGWAAGTNALATKLQ